MKLTSHAVKTPASPARPMITIVRPRHSFSLVLPSSDLKLPLQPPQSIIRLGTFPLLLWWVLLHWVAMQAPSVVSPQKSPGDKLSPSILRFFCHNKWSVPLNIKWPFGSYTYAASSLSKKGRCSSSSARCSWMTPPGKHPPPRMYPRSLYKRGKPELVISLQDRGGWLWIEEKTSVEKLSPLKKGVRSDNQTHSIFSPPHAVWRGPQCLLTVLWESIQL